ncbi:MAG: UBP-type zinc finger domain-containing protein [Chloroflexi bacterium]|nr:UBP-type zinc finger domain-containing protein [Chloroflexota bacterium]
MANITTREHLDQINIVANREGIQGCEECLKIGSTWVHLRMCLTCGQVGCCDSSLHRHARQHFNETKHAIMQSVEPGENWGWCYVDEVYLEKLPLPAS